MTCSECGAGNVGEIQFSTVASGARFNYCRHCETTWWLADERQIELDAVLQAARVLSRS